MSDPKPIVNPLLRWDAEQKIRREAGLYWTDEIQDLVRKAKAEGWAEGYEANHLAHLDGNLLGVANPYLSRHDTMGPHAHRDPDGLGLTRDDCAPEEA